MCGVTLRPGELETHFVQELERLYKLSANSRVRRLSLENSRPPLPPGSNNSTCPRRDGVGSAGDGTPEGRWEVSTECYYATYNEIRITEIASRKCFCVVLSLFVKFYVPCFACTRIQQFYGFDCHCFYLSRVEIFSPVLKILLKF